LESIILAFVVVAPLTRLALAGHGFVHFAEYNVLPFTNLDSLGFGALVALWVRKPNAAVAARSRLLKVATPAAAGGLVVTALISLPGNMEQTFFAVLFAAVVFRVFQRIGGVPGRLLENPVLIGLGTISYGIYVYHVFAPRAIGVALRGLDAPATFHSGFPLFVLSAALTLAVSALSWRLMERPILALSNRSSMSAARSPGVLGPSPGSQ
jgi:peptidoglycan/LPS O-acetylase OafA/YrhL